MIVVVFAFFLGVQYASIAGTESVLSAVTSPSSLDFKLPEWEQPLLNSTSATRANLQANASSYLGAGDDLIEDGDPEEQEEEEEDLFENFQIQWGTLENYQLLEVLGMDVFPALSGL